MWEKWSHIKKLSFVKLKQAAEAGSSAAGKDLFPNCKGCNKTFEKYHVKTCKSCHSVQYCSERCQRKDWKYHKLICKSINHLEKEVFKEVDRKCTVQSNVLNSTKSRLVQLVGEKCQIECSIGGKRVNALWDTGAQVSLISTKWLQNNIPHSKIRDVKELLQSTITIKGVIGSTVPYKGYVILKCIILGNQIDIPFLVTKDNLSEPIIGYNVISTVMSNDATVAVTNIEETFKDISVENSIVMAELMENNCDGYLSSVTVGKLGATVKAGTSTNLSCSIANLVTLNKTSVMFEPETQDLLPEGLEIQSNLSYLKTGSNRRTTVTVTNSSDKDIKIEPKLKLGDLIEVSSITPSNVYLKTKEDDPETSEDNVRLSAVETEESIAISQDKDMDEKYRQQLLKIELPDELSTDDRELVRKMLWEERDAFAPDEETIGCAEDLVMEIRTTDENPVQKRYNGIPRPIMTEVKAHIEDMLNRGWIKRSKSSWSSPVVIVRKTGGDIRLCCDFRQLNAKTVADKHPLPRVQEVLDNLGGSSWFSVVDLTRAYYQGFISPESRHKTAFVTPWGLYQWERIPFGLMNAPANFQRYMEDLMYDIRDKCAIPYLDDVIIYSNNFMDHVKHIRMVLRRIKKRGLKLRASKCDLFKRSVSFLGRIVSSEGYRMDEKNVKAVKTLEKLKPSDVSEVRQLLGLLGYHRRHIQDFSRIAKPITDLLLKPPEASDKKVSKHKVTWTEECEKAAKILIDQITKAPLLAYADFSKEFVLHTDASGKGIGAILYQRGEDRKLQVIGYASRALRNAEKKYHPTKLEFLALKWAVTESFREYLAYANHFLVLTDNNPLVYLMQAKKLNAFADRWVSELAEYNFTIRYRPGITNTDADCLSRLPLDISRLEELCSHEVDIDAFQAIMAGAQVNIRNEESWYLQTNASLIGNVNVDTVLDSIDIKKEQQLDPDIVKLLERRRSGEKLKTTITDSWYLKKLGREYRRLIIQNGLLVRKTATHNQIILPLKLREKVFHYLHNEMGHLGTDRVFELARNRFFWPGMQRDIDEYIHNRCQCIMQRKPSRNQQAPLQSISTSEPLELLTVDFLHLEKGSGGYEYILVIVDHFSKFAQAYPTRNKNTLTVAKHLYDDFILRFGIPNHLLSDQGGEFESKVIHGISKLMGVKKIRTTPYHPQTNGLCERMNRTILHMLRTLEETQKRSWPKLLNKLVHAYNCTQHSSTGFTPFHLMFGREATLPIDQIMKTNDSAQRKTHSEYVKQWEKQMHEVYRIVKKNQTARNQSNAKNKSKRPNLHSLKIGDRVLVRNQETGGPGKIRSYWEQEVYRVVGKKGGLEVVYEIQPEKKRKFRTRVVHRNMLLPVTEMFEEKEKTNPEPMKKTSENLSRFATNSQDVNEDTPNQDDSQELLLPDDDDYTYDDLIERPSWLTTDSQEDNEEATINTEGMDVAAEEMDEAEEVTNQDISDQGELEDSTNDERLAEEVEAVQQDTEIIPPDPDPGEERVLRRTTRVSKPVDRLTYSNVVKLNLGTFRSQTQHLKFPRCGLRKEGLLVSQVDN